MEPSKPALSLVPKKAAHTTEAESGDAKHLDRALANGWVEALTVILCSPDGGRFHLSLKAAVTGCDQLLWLNVFGDKAFCVDRAIKAIRAVIAAGGDKAMLQAWIVELERYQLSKATLLMLPEQP